MLIKRKEIKEKDGSIGYIESVFDSTNILKTTYFPQKQRIYIAFNRGGTYSYGEIDNKIYEEFENNESQGVFFQKKIKNKFPFAKEFTLYPNEVNEIKQMVEAYKTYKNDEDNE